MTLEDRLTNLFNLREDLRAIDKQRAAVQEDFDRLEYEIIQEMGDLGLSNAGVEACTVSIKYEKYPKVDDMEAFVNWCSDNGRSDMIQKRVSKTAFDEYFSQSNEYPDGVETYDKVTLNMRRR